jgi:hypothetical protein
MNQKDIKNLEIVEDFKHGSAESFIGLKAVRNRLESMVMETSRENTDENGLSQMARRGQFITLLRLEFEKGG